MPSTPSTVSRTSIASRFKAMLPGNKNKKGKKSASPAQQVVSSYKKERDQAQEEEQADHLAEQAKELVTAKEDEEVNILINASKSAPPEPTTQRQSTSRPPPSAYKPAISSSRMKFDPYLAIWNREEYAGLSASRNLAPSHYVPNAISIYETLDAAHLTMSGNRYIRKLEPGYLPLAVNAYIGILYHLRILTVRQAYGANSTRATQCLTRLERVIKLASLPVPIILRPHLESICAYKSSDERVGEILPFVPDNLGGNATEDLHRLASAVQPGIQPLTSLNGYAVLFSQPIPAIMLDWLRYFIDADLDAQTEYVAAAAGPPVVNQVLRPRHNYKGSFIPFPVGQDAAPAQQPTLAGTALETRAGRDDGTTSWYLNVLGTRNPAGFDFDRFKDAQSYWKNSKYATIGPQVTPTDADLSTPEGFLRLTENKDWMAELINQASIFCKYAGGAVSFNDLAISGLASASIHCDLHINPDFPAQHRNAHPRYYSRRFTSGTVEQTVYEDDLSMRDCYLARHVLTNARITYHRSIDAAAAGTSEYLTSAQGARIGPYYGRKVTGAPGAYQVVADGPYLSKHTHSMRVPVFEGRVEDFRNLAYRPLPDMLV